MKLLRILLGAALLCAGLSILAWAQQAAGPVEYGALPGCTDVTGNHLNYAAGAFTCGSSKFASPKERAPTQADDSTWNFSAGDYWTAPGGLWTNTLNTAGAAAWQPAPDLSAYVDKAVAAPLFAYAVKVVVAGFAGNCLDLRDTTHNTTQTLGFVNGGCDWATGDGFAAASGATVVVSKVYDQSGNVYDLTCATNYTTCLPYSQFRVNGVRALQWNGNYVASAGGTYPRMLNASVAITNEQAFSVAFVGRFMNGGDTQLPISMGSGSVWDQYYIIDGMWGTYDSTHGQFNFFASAGDAEPGFSLIVSSASPEVVTIDDRSITFGHTGNATSQALTGIALGGPSGLGTGSVPTFEQGAMDLWAIVGFNSALTTTQIAAFRQWAYSTWPIVPQLRNQLVVLGDSMMSGWGQQFDQNTMQDVRQMLTNPRRLINLAHGGKTCTTLTSNLTSGDYTTQIGWGAGHNILYGICGANDIIGGASATTVETNIQAWITAIRARDATDPLIIQNYWSFGGTTYDTVRNAVNTWIIANCATLVAPAGACVDFSTDSRIGVNGASNSSTYFNSDILHLNAKGAGVAASIIYQTLKNWQ